MGRLWGGLGFPMSLKAFPILFLIMLWEGFEKIGIYPMHWESFYIAS